MATPHCTITSKEQDAMLLQASVAVYVTVEVPGLNTVPLALPVPEPRVAPVMV